MDYSERGRQLAVRLRECRKTGVITGELATEAATYIETSAAWIKALSSGDYPQPAESKKKPVQKHKYGEYKNVLLSGEELDKLRERFRDADARIDKLSEYLECKNVSYKSHYAVILKWARDDEAKRRGESGGENSSFNTDEFFELALKRSYEKSKG